MCQGRTELHTKQNKEDVFTLALVGAFGRVEGDVRVGVYVLPSLPSSAP